MSHIKFGVVGLSAEGWAGMALVKPMLSSPLSNKYTLTALSTRSAESAAAAASKYSEITKKKVEAFHGDTSKIANDKDVDLVVVSVKTPSHKQAAMPVIEGGKDLFLEWPCGNGLQETKELLEAARSKGVRTMVGLQANQSPVIRKAKELISSGKIGRILSTTAILSVPKELNLWGAITLERNGYAVDEKNGATMLHIAIGHFISCFIPLLGDFSSVTATTRVQHPTAVAVDYAGEPTGKTFPQTGADQVAFSGVLTSGAVASVHCRGGLQSTKGRSPFVWVIDGEEGSIRMESDAPIGSLIQLGCPTLYLNGEVVKTEDEELGNIGSAWQEFAKGPDGNYPSLEDAVRVHCVIDAIARSSKEGRRIDIEQL